MGQTWQKLLFAHWPVDADAIRALVPAALRVDLFEGSAWLGVTPFRIVGLRLRGTPPIPYLSSFPELNVRTYVTQEGRPGIWFFSLDAASRLAVAAARRAYHLPYHHARMRAAPSADWIVYESSRREPDPRPFAFSARYRATGAADAPSPGTREHFLTERYCLYAADERGTVRSADIHHLPWPLQPAEVELELNTMAPDGIALRGEPLLHFADRQDVVIWPLQ